MKANCEAAVQLYGHVFPSLTHTHTQPVMTVNINCTYCLTPLKNNDGVFNKSAFKHSGGEWFAQSPVTQLCLCSLPGSLGHCPPTHLSNSFKPASFTDTDAQLTVVDFESHAGDLLCYYHHGPVEGRRTRTDKCETASLYFLKDLVRLLTQQPKFRTARKYQ